jgi:hypothetical protein
VRHCLAAARANPWSAEARGGHKEGVELFFEVRRASETPLTVVRARRRGVATVSHLGAVPRRVSSWVRTLLSPASFCPPKPRVIVPRRARERSSDEPPPPMALPHRTYAPHPSTGLNVSRLLVDGGSGLNCRYPFILIKFEPQIKKSMAERDLLCHGLMSRNHGPGP